MHSPVDILGAIKLHSYTLGSAVQIPSANGYHVAAVFGVSPPVSFIVGRRLIIPFTSLIMPYFLDASLTFITSR